MRPKLFLLCAAIGVSTLATPIGAQTKPVFLRSTCIKVNPGAGPEYEKLQADTIMKLAQYRIKQGAVLRYALSRAVLPAGEQSECDYLSSFSYPGFPTELTPEGTAKNLKAAGVTMSYEAYVARNRALSKPVATRIFRLTANAGTV